jgi:hypothetical protein
MSRKLIIGVGLVVVVGFACFTVSYAQPEQKDFYISITLSGNGAELRCSRGCAWEEFTYACPGELPCSFQIDEMGGGALP